MSALLGPLAPYRGAGVLVAVSGGADSVALLRALLEVGARPVAAHFDHRLRPESGADADWVRGLGAGLDVPVEVGSAEVQHIAARQGWNIEAAARTLRYAFLAQTAKRRGLNLILTAHTRRDQAETVLHALLRGEAKLTGIAAARGRVRRPWLQVARPDIEAYLRALGQEWREDRTNLDTRHTRNWLRHDVVPLLERRFPGLEASLARVATTQGEDDAALTDLAARVPAHADLTREPAAVLRRKLATDLSAAGIEYHTGHLQDLARAIQAGTTTHLSLPQGRQVTAMGGRLHLGTTPWPTPDFLIPAGQTLRHRRPGDRIRLPGGTRKLSDVLTDRRVPRDERDRVWLLADEQTVRWVGLNPPVVAVGEGFPPPAWHAEMGQGLALAREAARESEVPVGAVVVQGGPGGQVVGRGRNRSRERGDMTRHAELEALRDAVRVLGTPYLTDCTLVVTLEPCPMCYGAALEARVGRLVYGAPNPKLGALGGVADLSRGDWGGRPEIVPGVRAGEAAKLLRESFAALRADPPPAAPEPPLEGSL